MATAPLGSTERTNQLLAEASKSTGISAPTFPVTSSDPAPKPVDVPPYTPPAPAALDTILADYAKPSADQAALNTNQNDIVSRIGSLYDKAGTQAARQSELETQAGIPDLNKQLNEINTQIRSFAVQAKQFEVNQDNRNAPMFAITGAKAAAERQLSAKTFGLAAASEALQGNIALAQDHVKRALDAEFGPLQSQIDYQKTLLDLNKDKLSAADKKRADALTIQLNERSRLLDEQKTDKTTTYNLLTTAATNGAPNSVLSAIQAAPDSKSALQVAAPYLRDPLDVAYKKAQLANIYSSIGARNAASTYQTLNGKPQTATQSQVQGYADRTSASDSVISKLGAVGTSAVKSLLGKIPGVGNFLTGGDYQQLQQAQRDFVNAVLRRESGAAISPSEFESARQQYFPQPGDTQAVIAQKAQNRQLVINNLYQQANIQQPVAPGQIIEDAQGNRYQVGSDGVTLTPL